MTVLSRPRALVRGDRVAVLSASSPTDLDRLEVGLDTLRFAGLEPVVYPTARLRGTLAEHLAGTDAERAADLRAALLDGSIAGVLIAGGGYGSQRTLEVLDWTGLGAVPPKVVVGYSDVTALLEALAGRLGWTSLYGPMVASSEFGQAYVFAALAQLLFAPEAVGELRFTGASTLVGGSAEGVTCGGCLSLLAGSVGTDTAWVPDAAIVMLEDVTESAARIDTMLTHLRRSGYFARAAGVVVGTWTECGEPADVDRVLADRLGDLGVPVLMGANLGHGGHTQTYPIGVRVRLDVEAGTLTLLDAPLLPSA